MKVNNRVLAVGGAVAAALSGAYAQDRPNVLVIYTDDQGTLDVGCFGAPDLYTPNLDALAGRGVKLTQFYAAPVSSASRTGFMTGQYSAHNGVTGIVKADGSDGLDDEKETIAERMRANGYRTACIGKWHCGSKPESLPNNQGFDYFWGFRGGCIDSYSHFFYWNGANRHDLWRNEREIFEAGEFFVESSVREIRNFILEQDTDKPFFLYWAPNIPHYPLQPTEKWLDFYRDVPGPRSMYCAYISTFDEYVGEVTGFLESRGLLDNTIIIFQSDNGHSCESRTFGEGGYCGDYRGAKFSLFEGGIRVPAIISWPGHIPEGESRNQMLANIDWFPTIMELCGADPEGTVIDGKSFVPVLKNAGAKSPHDVLFFDHGKKWAMRYGDWKLLSDPVDIFKNDERATVEGLFLVNLAEDHTESTNLAGRYPEIVKKMLELRKGCPVYKPHVK